MMLHISGPVRSVVAVVAAALLLIACGETGSGTIVTETRDVGEFTQIEVNSGVDVRLVVDPARDLEVAVTYDDNLLDKVGTDVEGDTLVVGHTGSIRVPGDGRFVAVVVGDIEAIAVGSGANITGNGTVEEYSVDASSGANVDLRELEATRVDVDASSGANVSVSATESVRVDASSGANVDVYGNPADVSADESSGANIDVRG